MAQSPRSRHESSIFVYVILIFLSTLIDSNWAGFLSLREQYGRRALKPGSPLSRSMQQARPAKLRNPTGEISPTELRGFSRSIVHKPVGQPAGSLIWLLPFNAKHGWLKEWMMTETVTKHAKYEGSHFQQLLKQNLRIIEARGRDFVWVDDGYGTEEIYTAWYGYENWEDEVPNAKDLDSAVAYVHKLIEQEAMHYYYDYRRIVLAGYSHGACLALEAGIRFKMQPPLALVVSQRGIVYSERTRGMSRNASRLPATPYIFSAGLNDNTYWAHEIQDDCKHLNGAGAPSFFKLFTKLDHYKSSHEENDLTLRSLEVVLTNTPAASAKKLAKLTLWQDCKRGDEWHSDASERHSVVGGTRTNS